MDVFQIIFLVIIIITMGGCVCDWVFSGMVNPMNVDEPVSESYPVPKDEPPKIEHVIFTCPNCGKESKYSFDVMETFGMIRCQNCGGSITKDD